MRHARRSALALFVLGATCLLPATAAVAGSDVSAAPPVLQSNWYWHQVNGDAPVGGLPAAPEPSGVPVGDLPVASRDGAGTSSKLPLIAFSLPKVPVGSSVTAFDVTLKVDANAQNVMSEVPKLVAEPALRNWPNGKGGEQDVPNAPPLESTLAVPGTASPDSTTWVFHLSGLAQGWLDDANFGFGIVPMKGYTTPFQVSFLGGKDVKATLTYAAATDVPPASGSTGTGAAPGAATAGGGGSGSTPPLSLGGSTGVGGLTGSSGTSTAVPPALAGPSLAGPSAAQPQVAGPQVAAVPAAAAAAFAPVSSLPGVGLLVLGVGVLALLVLLSLTLGGQPGAVAVRRTSRLSSVLTDRVRRPDGPSTALV